MKSIVLAALLAILAPAAFAASPPRATGAWFRYLLPSIPAGGYVTLTNSGPHAIVLTGVSSPACGSLMFHRTESQGGTDRMIVVPRIRIPAGGTFRFAPGGYHIMCMSPHMHPGQTVPVTFRLANGTPLTVRFAVRGANASGPPSPGTAPMRMKMQ